MNGKTLPMLCDIYRSKGDGWEVITPLSIYCNQRGCSEREGPGPVRVRPRASQPGPGMTQA